jgi:alkylation response protein AidB-like acyl-CoA dehydrogenase
MTSTSHSLLGQPLQVLRSDPTHSPDINAYRDRVRSWLSSHLPGQIPTGLDARFDALRSWQKVLYDGGFVGISLPSAWGGQGLDAIHEYVFVEELAAAGYPPPVGLIGLDVVGPSIAAYGTTAQREALLPPLLAGDDIWCQGFSEPDAGSDLAAIRTSAVLDADAYIVTGQKVWTSWAHKATWCALLVRTGTPAERHRGLSYLLVPMDSPGITVRPIRQMTGESEFCEVFFDNVRVPTSGLLGDHGSGWTMAMDTLSHERATYAFRRRVECASSLSTMIEQLRGDPGELDRRRLEALGSAAEALFVLEAQNLQTLRRISQETGPSAIDSVDKLIVNMCEQQLFRALHDVVTGASAPGSRVSELDAGLALRDYLYSRAASIYGGTAQIQRNIIASRGLKLPAQGA